jgi:hypothetical protein
MPDAADVPPQNISEWNGTRTLTIEKDNLQWNGAGSANDEPS